MSLLTCTGAMKVPEMILSFIILIICRFGNRIENSNAKLIGFIPWGGSLDSNLLGTMIVFATVMILVAQIIGILFGDTAPIQGTLLALLIGFCYFVAGVIQVSYFWEAVVFFDHCDSINGTIYCDNTYSYNDYNIINIDLIISNISSNYPKYFLDVEATVATAFAMGILAIIGGLVFLVDAAISAVKLRNFNRSV